MLESNAALRQRCLARSPPVLAAERDQPSIALSYRSQVWMMTLRKFQPYRSDFGFFDSPPARARNVTGTSTTRARWRSASIRISLVQN